MGNSPSSPEQEDPYDPFDGIDTLGYRVLGVQPNSPAAKAGLVSFLDFLVGANQRMLLGSGEGLEDGEEYDDVDLPMLLEENKGRPVEFLVFNIKSQESRLIELTPSDTWGGAGLLGVTIRLDNYAGAEDRLIRVLEVEDKSPAAIAGLVPFKDYLLGTTTTSLDSTATLADLLRSHQDKVVELYVYNCDSDVVRVVALMPTLSWEGGRGGFLGAAVGTGYLHRLPSSVRYTEGVSVERKVRYVGMSNNNNSKQQQPTDPSKTGIPTLGAEKAILELEPQLEMEPPEEDEDDTQDASGEMSSVALSSVDGGGQDSPEDRTPKRPEREFSQVNYRSSNGGTYGHGKVASQPGISTDTASTSVVRESLDTTTATKPAVDDSGNSLQRSASDAPGTVARDVSPPRTEVPPHQLFIAATAPPEGVGGGPRRSRRSLPPDQQQQGSHPPFNNERKNSFERQRPKRCNSADELFALPEPPPSPKPEPVVRTTYASPTSFTNFLPPPPKMSYGSS